MSLGFESGANPRGLVGTDQPSLNPVKHPLAGAKVDALNSQGQALQKLRITPGETRPLPQGRRLITERAKLNPMVSRRPGGGDRGCGDRGCGRWGV